MVKRLDDSSFFWCRPFQFWFWSGHQQLDARYKDLLVIYGCSFFLFFCAVGLVEICYQRRGYCTNGSIIWKLLLLLAEYDISLYYLQTNIKHELMQKHAYAWVCREMLRRILHGWCSAPSQHYSFAENVQVLPCALVWSLSCKNCEGVTWPHQCIHVWEGHWLKPWRMWNG